MEQKSVFSVYNMLGLLHKDSVLLLVLHLVAVDTVSPHLKATRVIITT